MIEIPTGLPPEIVPLSWLLGVWEGTGVIDYVVDDTVDRSDTGAGSNDDAAGQTSGTRGDAAGVRRVQHEFGQRVSFSNDGLPYLNYSSFTWLLDEQNTPLVSEIGYWRLNRAMTESDPGPGMLPGLGSAPYPDAEAVETLRNSDGGFDLQVSLVHPGGVSELYLGQVKGPRIDLSTDLVMRTQGAAEYSAATRMYGLVEKHLLWAWDIAALGQSLRTHASARLAHVD